MQAIAELRVEIEQLGERMDQRLGTIEQLVGNGEFVPGQDLAVAEQGAATALKVEEQTKALAARVAESVQVQLDAKLERLASRQRNRNMGGEWKAPMDELAEELELTDRQKDTAIAIFDEARDDVYDLLKAERPDGGSLLDDLATSIRNGEPDALPKFLGRLFSDHVPGSDQTYLARMLSLSEKVRTDLSTHLSDVQLQKLNALKVAVLEVETGYDPVAEYIQTRSQ